jgi:hypothetical protein
MVLLLPEEMVYNVTGFTFQFIGNNHFKFYIREHKKSPAKSMARLKP